MKTAWSFFEAREDAAKAFEPAEQSLDLVAAAVQCFLDSPGLDPLRMGRNDGNEAQIERELASLVAFICAVHQQMAGERELWSSLDRVQQCPTLGGIPGLSWRE